MSSSRNTILVTHASLPPPLARTLAGLGLSVVETAPARLEGVLTENVLGVYTWFYEGLRHPHIVWIMRQRLRRRGVPLFVWNRDAPHYLNRASWRLDLLDRARLYDLYCTHALADERRQFAEAALYLPNAADLDAYNLGQRTLADLRNETSYEYDVGFLGSMDGSRYKEMRARQEFFGALGERLRSMGLRFLFREAKDLPVARQVELIQKTRINLNFGAACEYGAKEAVGLPERCYGIPACGGFLLSDRRRHARDDFVPGQNWADFEGLEDCVARIRFWLDHFQRARDLAERAHHHVLAHHTYRHRAMKLRDALLAWHAGERGWLR